MANLHRTTKEGRYPNREERFAVRCGRGGWRGPAGALSRLLRPSEGGVIAAARPNLECLRGGPLQADLDLAPGAVRAIVGGDVPQRVLRADLRGELFVDRVELLDGWREEDP